MALSADANRLTASPDVTELEVANADVVYYQGFFPSIKGPVHADTTERGFLTAFAGAKGEIPLGTLANTAAITGDASGDADRFQRVPTDDVRIRQVAVTGVTAVTDVGKHFYASDDDTLTLTRPTRGFAAGLIIKHHTGTTVDVILFGSRTLLAMQGVGQREIMYFGKYALANVTTANIRTAMPMQFRGKFVSFHGAVVDVVVAGSTADIDFNLEIGGTNVTGGVVTISEGDADGSIQNGTAITAANEFHEGDTVDVEAVVNQAATGGSVELFAVVERMPGI